MNNPFATYRLQFHKDFTFSNLRKLIPYFEKLGIGAIYASPIFKSTTGSTHGYDGVNPNQIDPEIGGLDELMTLSGELKDRNISWLQDIVPNHMAFHPENPWLMDVLEKGMQSAFAKFFDIAWNSRLYHGKLMVPFLGVDMEDLLDDGEIKIAYAAQRFMLQYEDSSYPLNARSYFTILSDEKLAAESMAIVQLAIQIRSINGEEEATAFTTKWNELLLQLSALMNLDDQAALIVARLDEINGDQEKLREIVDQQTYVLCNWQKTDQQINFRRFFTVNGLICLNIQDEEVFDKYHMLTKSLIDKEIFQGIRIDHVDGLYDPTHYLSEIRKLAGVDSYVVVEKILGSKEDLPGQWPVQGTTGYEFLSWVNNLQTYSKNESLFTRFYNELTGNDESSLTQLHQKKADILFGHMGGELENLYQLFIELNLAEKKLLEKVGKDRLREAIGEFLIHCPVYRYYGNKMPLNESEKKSVAEIFNLIRQLHPALEEAIQLLESAWFSGSLMQSEAYAARALEFYQRCMQFTGPMMAKGGEDTLMYTYLRFIGHNDVGDSPENFGLSIQDFHTRMKERSKQWPMTLNATSTHDTKRGEDVRARLNVLTDLAEEWISNVKDWQNVNAAERQKYGAPDTNNEYLIYQMLVGCFPMQGEEENDFPERFEEYLQKAQREAKVHTFWAEPNESYENGTRDFVRSILKKDGAFWPKFSAFHERIADFGIVNSLTQLALKFMTPGVPDVYQGCELWDFSMVDPDNRRPVDYEKRRILLGEMDGSETFEKLWESRKSGKIKLWLTEKLFSLRRKDPVLFSEGDYIALKVQGAYKGHVIAFGRKYKGQFLIVALPLYSAKLCSEQGMDFFNLDWKDTKILLPPGLNVSWMDELSATNVNHQNKLLPGDLFRKLPVAILSGSKVFNKRGAGILLHITSLPSRFGVGDLGPEAYAFADFLSKAKQKIWQMLPLNPTEESQMYSPYSALSSRAGNPLLISPEVLVSEGLLVDADLEKCELPTETKTDYRKAEVLKMNLLKNAYGAFLGSGTSHAVQDFDEFCECNKEWLDYFALYSVIREQQKNRPWIEWEEQFKLRDHLALESFASRNGDGLRFIKWVQYIFDKQWKALRHYCNAHEITLFGDMPFYVSYNSADVWAHRNLFLLDEHGAITGMAGVPPDSFSDDGQLWGMPVFNWEKMKEQGYRWWIDRLRKNMELFDLLRLDHFRAFADYWQVPGGEKTAVRGAWKLGPDAEFFEAIKSALGSLPFVAEDLGESSPPVYVLRDKFELPGMKVLQFAFDEHMPVSEHIPHHYLPNFIAYTGTHDNNTIRGWYRSDIDDDMRNRLEKYAGTDLGEDNVNWIMARMIYSSVAETAILPAQDVLNLDERFRMNNPSAKEGNWLWRLVPGQISAELAGQLAEMVMVFNRD